MRNVVVLAAMLVALSDTATAQGGAPNLARYDQCISAQVRARASTGQSVNDAQKERIARAAVTSCDALLPPALSDYKRLTLSMVRNTPYAAQAAKASDDQWRAKLIAMRISMARGLIGIATASPPPAERSGRAGD